MLFLAVFCGFLAEYQLEHTIEHQWEKEYAKALYDELHWRILRQQHSKQTVEPTYEAAVKLLSGIKQEYHLK